MIRSLLSFNVSTAFWACSSSLSFFIPVGFYISTTAPKLLPSLDFIFNPYPRLSLDCLLDSQRYGGFRIAADLDDDRFHSFPCDYP